MLDGDTGGLVARVICIVWRVFLLACRVRLLSSHSVFPDLRITGSLAERDTVGFDLIGVYGGNAIACVVDGLVPSVLIRRGQILVLWAARAVDRRRLEFIVRRVGN